MIKSGIEAQINAVKEYASFFDDTLVDSNVPLSCIIYDPYAYFLCTTPEAKELVVNSVKALNNALPTLFEHPIVRNKLQATGLSHVTSADDLIKVFETSSPSYPWNFMACYFTGTPSTADKIFLRTKYIDDVVMENQKTIKQIVVIGAGMDMRALRLEFDQEITVFEVDTPQVIEYKTNMLTKTISKHITPRSKAKNCHVSADLRFAEQWTKQLVASGYDPTKPSFWLAEGLLMYLSEDEIDVLLKTVSSMSAPGSKILIQTVEPIPPATTPEMKMLYMMSAPIGEFRSFTTTPNLYLDRAGFGSDIVLKNYLHLVELYGAPKQNGTSSAFTIGTKPSL
ncbi:hypothetical protein SAMD00019534_018470 [Acytostelium subglobosum LB1]|uniref:hypothetical protein n=1 Tax=Acytostelium subglobosum LB1 TaxID=1410327 RepID=UPI0006451790|nr:hypothetical protein SAMD00019534_018470 [Acytostelium subglobosum LB1]GAM18672.1 hypothetical protein SAMD00019534_018470 [Acytostelium subglobosum LB1]|eukprot:XP_012757892.1 hypothetical protein SAMD00019534_018470 [Acytostelium subglobosum LB1]